MRYAASGIPTVLATDTRRFVPDVTGVTVASAGIEPM